MEPEYDDTSVSEQDAAQAEVALPEIEPVQWQAQEYTQQDKPPLWYVGFGIVTVVLMLLALVFIKSWSFVALIPVMAVALLVYAHRPPHVVRYVVSTKGLFINDTLHPMSEFRSFGVDKGEEHNTLVLVPVKRFRPTVTVLFPSDAGEAIVDALGAYIPFEHVRQDVFDRLISLLKI